MTTPTRRISFYLKPAVVKSEREACSYLDSLPVSERSRAQRAAFLAGLALINVPRVGVFTGRMVRRRNTDATATSTA